MCKLGQEGGAPIGRSRRGTSLKERYNSLYKVAGSAANLAFAPVRWSGAILRYFDEKLTNYEQRRAWDRNVKGTWLDPEKRESWWTSIGKVIPDPRKYH